jgi:hypothetical protein
VRELEQVADDLRDLSLRPAPLLLQEDTRRLVRLEAQSEVEAAEPRARRVRPVRELARVLAGCSVSALEQVRRHDRRIGEKLIVVSRHTSIIIPFERGTDFVATMLSSSGARLLDVLSLGRR